MDVLKSIGLVSLTTLLSLVVLFLLLQFVLPPFLGLDGVWLSPPAAQAALALVSVVLIAVAARQARRTAG